jgi:hypothetical protein
MIVMILATGFHISRGELSNTLVTIPLGLLSAFVAWGRFFKAPMHLALHHEEVLGASVN